MAIKQQPVLTKEDFESALVALRLSVSEVARETGLARHIVSHYRNYGDGLKPEQAAKLRDFFESKGLEFTDEEAATPPAAPPERAAIAKDEPAAIASPHPRLDSGLVVEHYFPISNAIPSDVIGNAMDIMEEADARLVELLKTKVQRDDGLFGSGDPTDETFAVLQEVFALLAGNYLVFRMLRGWRAFNIKPASEAPETVRDMIFETFRQHLIDAGLIEPEATESTPEKAEAEQAEVAE